MNLKTQKLYKEKITVKKKKITDSWREATKYPANIQFPGDELKSDNNDAEEKNYKYFSKI